MLDHRQLIGQVAAKNGIRLEPDDPAFALVTLNEAVLQDASAVLTQEVRQLLNDFADSLKKAEQRAGKALAQDVRTAAAEIRRELSADIETASLKANEIVAKVSAANARPTIVKWSATGALSGLLLFLIGVVVGARLVAH